MRNFIHFFAKRGTLANVFTFMVIFMGLNALMVIQRDTFPNVDFDEVVITTRYPGASPEDVELNVTNKIEKELKEVDGLNRVTSFSMENISIVHLKLDPDSKDKKKVKTDIRDAVARVSSLPLEVTENPNIRELTTATAIPIIEVGITGDIPYTELREIARRAEKRLRSVPGVASLTKYSYLDREIKVEINQDKLKKYQIPAQEVVTAIRNRNIRSTGGSFESFTSGKNIVTLAQFDDPQQVGEAIVRVGEDGSLVRIRDLAVIKDGFEPEKVRSRMNGKSAISFIVYKKESADMIRTVDAIKALVEENRHRLPASASIEYSNDQSRIVRNRLEVVTVNGVMGLALVLIMLTLFLNLRLAFWVAMGIPVTLLGTLFLLPLFGAYLDSIALAAMILVIGIIVDDGIVIGENIWRQRELGLAPLEAAVEGTASVFRPVLTTILTTALAFAPMFFMSGTLGDFVFVIPLVVVLALLVSFAEITIAMPAHLIAGSKPGQSLSTGETQRFQTFKNGFERLLRRILNLRYGVLGLFCLLLAGSFWYAGKYLDFVLFPSQSADELHITVELPSGSSLEHTTKKIQEVEALVQNLPSGELDSFVTRIGNHGEFNMGENENWAFLGVYLTPYATRDRNADEIVEDLRGKFSKLEGITNFNFIVDSGGPPVGRPITLRVVGSNDELRNNLADKIIAQLGQIPGVKDIDRDDKLGKDQVRIDLDFIRLADAGLTVADIAESVRLSYDGEIVTSVRYGEDDVEFRVILDEKARSSVNALQELVVPNQQGRFVQLHEIGNLVNGPGPSNYFHFDNERTITITAGVDTNKVTPLQATNAVQAAINIDQDWPGMRLLVGGEAEETQSSMGSLIIASATAAVGIYLILLLLFNSVVQPLVVMLAIPFGLIGVIFAFAVHQQALGFLAMLGVIGLIGIVVNDSLILVNLVNDLRKSHPQSAFVDLIAEATKTRVRPILLTSITTVAGLLPMAYGLGGSDPFSAPMALAMGYGILFATPLTLILLPCMLAILQDFRQIVMRFSST